MADGTAVSSLPVPPASEWWSWVEAGVVEHIFGHPRGGAGPPVECVLQGEMSRGCHSERSNRQCTCLRSLWKWALLGGQDGSCMPQLAAGAGACRCLSWGGRHGGGIIVGGSHPAGRSWGEVLAKVTVVGQGKVWPLSFRWPSLFLSVDSCCPHGHVTLKDLW